MHLERLKHCLLSAHTSVECVIVVLIAELRCQSFAVIPRRMLVYFEPEYISMKKKKTQPQRYI